MTTQGPLLLIIEDEPQMVRFLRASLSTHGYRLIESVTAADGLAQAAARNPDLILLDLGLPDLDGLEVTRRIREWARTPIIVLSARGQDEDKIGALDAGADDYLTKPFSVGELLARMRVALRHATNPATGKPEPVFTLDELRIDFGKREVFVGDKEVHLTPTEYKLLTVLVHWRVGRGLLGLHLKQRAEPLDGFIASLEQRVPSRIPGTAVFMASGDGVPPAMRRVIARFQTLQQTVILLTIVFEHVPRVAPTDRVRKIVVLDKGFHRLVLHYGFLEEPDVHGDGRGAARATHPHAEQRATLRGGARDLRRVRERPDGQGLGRAFCVLVPQREERDRLLSASTRPGRRGRRPHRSLKPSIRFRAATALPENRRTAR
jgi:two-component system KDP operon response regulator KdpE